MALPWQTRLILMLGPIRNDKYEDCRVCEAFDYVPNPGWDAWYELACADDANGTDLAGPVPANEIGVAVAILKDYHEGRDLYFHPKANYPAWQLGEGNLVYDRCLLIYLAAGWQPWARR